MTACSAISTGQVPVICALSATIAVGWILQGGRAAGIEVEVVVVRLVVGGRAAIFVVVGVGLGGWLCFFFSFVTVYLCGVWLESWVDDAEVRCVR